MVIGGEPRGWISAFGGYHPGTTGGGVRIACAKLTPFGDGRLDSSVDASIRIANEADVDEMLDVLFSVASEGRWIGTEVSTDRSQRYDGVLKTLQRADARLFVAVVDDAVVGHLGVSSRRPGLLEFGMVVAADHRGKGIGSALLAACVDWCREIGAYKILLEVFPNNDRARALYRKFGFTDEGHFSKHLRRANGELWDVIPMGLVLEDVAKSSS